MTLVREINRLVIGVLVVFVVIALSATHWAIVGPDTILRREDNPRLVIAEARIQRGEIADRHGDLLAESIANPVTGQVTRHYPHPEASSLLGYNSLRYGVGGAEAAFNATLRGDNLTIDGIDQIMANILHRPKVGSDIQLTLDLEVQQVMAQAMGDQIGAAVVLSVPDGQLLGLISLPTYDPNTLDADWDMLAAAPQKPFFNRVLQGQYQPGGTMQTPLMAAALLANQSLTEPVPEATIPVQVSDVAVHCALRLPIMELSLRDAYAFACPLPFETLALQLGVRPINSVIELLQMGTPVTLAGFPAQPPAATSIAQETLIDDALGQGAITVTPLQMAVLVASIVNDGNAPQPYVLMATHAPEAADWVRSPQNRPTLPYMTERTARQLQDLMRNTVANGAALNAARPGIDIGGHAALAYSGTETQSWFIGFATLPGRRGVAAAVVLENSEDPGLAADIGGAILSAAHQNFSQNTP